MVLVQILKIFSLKIEHIFLSSLKTLSSKIIFLNFLSLCQHPVRWGIDTFYHVHVRVRVCVSITPSFLFPRALALDFCYDLDLCSQGQAVRAFLSKWVFPNFVKSIMGVLIKTCLKTS